MKKVKISREKLCGHIFFMYKKVPSAEQTHIKMKGIKHRHELWSPDEDEKLIRCMQEHHGNISWSSVPLKAGLKRSGKSCRLRWVNYLRPELKRGKFSAQEQEVVMNLYAYLGSRWSQISKYLPGRTDHEIKNFCKCAIRREIKSSTTAVQYYPEQVGVIRNAMELSSSSHFAKHKNKLPAIWSSGFTTEDQCLVQQSMVDSSFSCAQSEELNNNTISVYDYDLQADQAIFCQNIDTIMQMNHDTQQQLHGL